MPITPDDVACTASLARLELTTDEIARFGRDLARITEYMAQLSEAVADVTDYEPVLPLIREAEAFRADSVVSWQGSDVVIRQAPDTSDRFFRVPKVIG